MVLADAGYCNEAEARQVGDARGGRYAYALGREGRRAVEVDVSEKHPAKARMCQKAGDRGGAGAVRQSAQWLSIYLQPIGWIKEALGFRRFSVRGSEQGPGRMLENGVLGVERQADARA